MSLLWKKNEYINTTSTLCQRLLDTTDKHQLLNIIHSKKQNTKTPKHNHKSTMKAAFLSALAVAGNVRLTSITSLVLPSSDVLATVVRLTSLQVAYCQDDAANSDAVCSPSKGGKVCGAAACNGLVSTITENPNIYLDGTEDGEHIFLASSAEPGCEFTITLLVSFFRAQA